MFKKISKRSKFVLTAVFLSLGLVGVQFTDVSWRYWAIAILSIASYFSSAWALKEGLSGIEWITVLILPTLYTASVGLFYFLIPAKWITGVPVIFIYGIGIYALMLIENIFSVAAIRTIQLLRSAQAVGFLLTLITSFFLYDTIFSFRADFWVNFLAVFLISFPLILQAIWSVNLEEKISLKNWFYIGAMSLIQGEAALVFSFWPLTVAVRSLALTTSLYVTLGLVQYYLLGRLFPKLIGEFLRVGIIVFLVIFLTTRWGE